MKGLKLAMVFATIMLAAVSCGPKKTTQKVEEGNVAPRILVLFYSQTGNTKFVATEMATRLGADIEEIVPKQLYDGDFQSTIERGRKEHEEGVFPEIQPINAELDKYDVVFLGYPVWFGTYAPPIASFLNLVDLSGKKIVPFCTFGSGGLESSTKDLVEAEPNAEILPGYGIRAARLAAVSKEIDNFLKAGGFINGEYTKLEEFPAQHPVSEEEAAIFDAAVDGYRMLHAKATTVASRAIPEGTEYLFIAVDLPKDGKNDTASVAELQVYVMAAEGENPVFTKVIR